MVECPACKLRGGLKRKLCKCGHNVQKTGSKNYWIDYYIDGKRTRERIGRSKQAAENRLREVQTAKAEVGRIKQLEENNIRERVLSQDEFKRLLSNCSGDIKGFVLIAYYLPMRQKEIINLTWEEIDFKHGFIRIGVIEQKTKPLGLFLYTPKL